MDLKELYNDVRVALVDIGSEFNMKESDVRDNYIALVAILKYKLNERLENTDAKYMGIDKEDRSLIIKTPEYTFNMTYDKLVKISKTKSRKRKSL